MIKCPNCEKENEVGKMFCGGCGDELPPTTAVVAAEVPAANATVDPDPGAALAPTPATVQPTGDAVCTMKWISGDPAKPGELSLPMFDGVVKTIARQNSDKCTPDFAIPTGDVPRVPVHVTVNGRTVTVKDTGSTQGFYLAKRILPGESGEIDLDKGEYLLFVESAVSFE